MGFHPATHYLAFSPLLNPSLGAPLLSAQVTLLPAGVYVATHWAVLFQFVHMWSLLLLTSGPLVFVCSLKGEWVGGWGGWAEQRNEHCQFAHADRMIEEDSLPAGQTAAPLRMRPNSPPAPPATAAADGLWWLGEGRAVSALRRLLLLVSLAVFLLAVEER